MSDSLSTRQVGETLPTISAEARDALALREREAIARYERVREAPEEIFGRIATLATQICQAPLATVSLLDGERHLFIGISGHGVQSLPRDQALSELSVQAKGIITIEDARTDPRTASLDIVTGSPHIRGYASIPLCPDGTPVGALAVADPNPRVFTEAQLAGLKSLAELAERQLQSRILLDEYTHIARENVEVKRSLKLLHDLTAIIGESPDFDRTCTAVLEKICRETGWTIGQIWERRPDGQTLACSPNAYSTMDEGSPFLAASREIYFEPGEGLPGTAWSTGKPVWVRDLTQTDVFPRAQAALDAGIRTGMAFPVKAGDDVVAIIEFFAPNARDEDKHLVRLVSTVTSELGTVFQRKRVEDLLEHHAGHDSLTGLPNRLLFMDRLSVAIEEARRTNQGINIILVGLDSTTSALVNETLGHSAGDELRRRIAARLEGQLRKSDTLARVGGGVFAVLIRNFGDDHEATKVAGKLQRCFDEPLQILDQTVYGHANIGISAYPQDGSDSEAILSAADSALFDASLAGRDALRRFTPSMLDAARDRLVTETAIRLGLERQEFVVHYQPQIDIVSGNIVAAEALLRWNHPQRGMVSPMEFIPIAEATDLIHPLGDFVMQRACEQAMEWEDTSQRVAVNLSPNQFQDPLLVSKVRSVLDRTGLPAARLELEITESIAMKDIDLTIRVLEELQAIGICVAVDDFGTGYSSLYYLKRIPLTRLKVDRAFIRDLAESDTDRAILRAILELVGGFNASHLAAGREQCISVVAEGVETEEQLDILRGMHCHMAQGYLFSKPVSQDQLGELFATLRDKQVTNGGSDFGRNEEEVPGE